MARRIEVELTSSRDGGTWTWRAAGARQPKGELDGGLLYPGAKVGDVVRVEAEFHLDGIEVTIVFPPKEAKSRPEVLEMVSRPLRDDELVTTTRVGRRDGGGRDDRRRGPRGPGGPRSDDRSPRDAGRRRDRDGGSDGDRAPRGPRPEPEARPRPRRLRPRRTHRDAVMADVPEEFRPIAERVLAGGIPEVRKALEEQNAAAKAAGGPEVAAGPILAIAEDLFTRLRAAEWRDRADAALTDLDDLDLRDLRSVVVAADAAARDDESRAIAEQLREGLNRRIEGDHAQWMADLSSAVGDGRVVRALRLSSRPVKAGAPLPQELAATLAEMASAALAADISQDRWATVLDAVAFSPVRAAVNPVGIPAEPSSELREAATKVADRVPHIATALGIDPTEAGRARTRTRRARSRRPEGERPAGAGRPAPGSAERRPQAPTADGSPLAEDLGGLPESPADGAPATPDSTAADASPAGDAPGADVPTADAPAGDPGAGDPGAGDAVQAGPADGPADAPAPDAADAPVGDGPEAGAPAPDGPPADAPVGDGPEAGAPAPDGPPAGAPAAGPPAQQAPAADAGGDEPQGSNIGDDIGGLPDGPADGAVATDPLAGRPPGDAGTEATGAADAATPPNGTDAEPLGGAVTGAAPAAEGAPNGDVDHTAS